MIPFRLPITFLRQTKFKDCPEFKKNYSSIIYHMLIGGLKKKI